jgi:predicted ester cyclase
MGSLEMASLEMGGIEMGGIEMGGIEMGGIEMGSIEMGSIEMGSIEEPAAVYAAYNDAENAKNFPAMTKLVSADLRVEVNGQVAVSSADEDQRAMLELFCTYPDYRREIEEILVAGDRATVRWRMWGTAGIDGIKPLDVSGCSVVSVRGGQITHAFLYYEGAALNAVLTRAGGR